MTKVVDRSSVDELLRAASPSRVAEALGIAVVKRGANLRCICPFHDDHDPSLVLYDKWDAVRPPHYHCFVCGADGDIFDLVKHIQHSSFGEAVDWLRSTFGLPRRSSQVTKGRRRRESPETAAWDGHPKSALEQAKKTFLARNHSPEFGAWLKKRHLPIEIAAKAGLAYASANTLTEEISRTGVDLGQSRVEAAMFEEVGLLRRVRRASTSEHLFDQPRYRDFFFDDRIIFPIQLLSGEVAGFAGRALTDVKKELPKYLYTPGLKKGSILYRGHAAVQTLTSDQGDAGRKELYICEGLIDCLRLESLGLAAVSILGAQASKEQIAQLSEIANRVAPSGNLQIHIFLDRDKAGVRGSAKLAAQLAEAEFDADFIWPTKSFLESLNISEVDAKDPDSLLLTLSTGTSDVELVEYLREWRHPTALPVIAKKLEEIHQLDELLDNDIWNSISLGVRYRAAGVFEKDSAVNEFLLSTGGYQKFVYPFAWYADVAKLLQSRRDAHSLPVDALSAEFIADEDSRLNVARVLAKSGADRGEVPTDEAAWRRLESGATAFNIGLRERLGEPSFEPLEPFDAVFVARDFEKTEPRLKAMPCPEDLILQQYLLLETLTERFDVTDEENRFSFSIPAVRYYRGSRESVTTCEDGSPSAKSKTLSFAYQIDMDVLEGRARAGNQGMFRPYIECWRDFIGELQKTANGFEEVFALRLDLKRYYDRLYRSTVQDALRAPISEAVGRLERSERKKEFAPSFSRERQNIAEALVDWYCEQSFGYQYYHPETGKIAKAESSRGIPQGPVLSAWLATVALFPLDSELRKVLDKLNESGGLVRAGYARYVDDIFLIADSPEILEELRSAVEDACARLRLEAIPKGEMASRMSPEEFKELLTEGKALVGSGPSREIGLLTLGDGESGFETWQDLTSRASSLVLLSDRRLYEFDVDAIKRQVFTALNAYDLRPAELSKASRWIWYAVAKEKPVSAQGAWETYWLMWGEVTERLAPRMNIRSCPWLDPSFYALDGLELLLRSATTYDRNLSRTAENERSAASATIARLVAGGSFFSGFAHPPSVAPQQAGLGVVYLRRMFLQRAVCVRWIARQMQPAPSSGPLIEELDPRFGRLSNELTASLVRANLTDADGATVAWDLPTNVGERLDYESPLRSLFLWLHEAIVLLGRAPYGTQDPLESIRGKLQPPSNVDGNEAGSSFYGLLNFWRPTLPDEEIVMLQLRLDALSAFLAVCHVDGLLNCLQQRRHLVGDIGDSLPALPGVPVRYLVLRNNSVEDDRLTCIRELYPPDRPPPEVEYQIATASEVSSVTPAWTDLDFPVDSSRLLARETPWAGPATVIRRTQPMKPESVGFRDLQWAADCYEALARINYELAQECLEHEGSEVLEFVPAWPFIVASHWPGTPETSDAKFSLYGPVVPREHLANFAFARDGRGRLRVHEVPLADARLWRIGFAVTDALGMVDELERFQALEVGGRQFEISTPQYVLSRLLGRLRGEGQPASPGLPHPNNKHLTGSTNRALLLLRNFPRSRQEIDEVQYLLAVETETAAMRLHADGHGEFTRPGALAAFLASLAPAVFVRLTAKQLESLPQVPLTQEHEASSDRRVVAAWRHLDHRLELLELALRDGIPDQSRHAWTALRRGVRAAAITAQVRAVVFEIHLAGFASPSASVEAPVEWAIDEPLLALDNQETNVGELFRDALAPKGRLALAANITPLGWLAILASQLNLYGIDGSRASVPLAIAVGMQEEMTLLSQQLSASTAEAEQADEEWPFDAFSTTERFLGSSSFESGLRLLRTVQEYLGYRVRICRSHIWGLPPQAKYFSDERGRQWPLVRGLIEQFGRDRHIESDEDEQRVWTETSTSDGRLVGVSVLGEAFSKTVGFQRRIDSTEHELGHREIEFKETNDGEALDGSVKAPAAQAPDELIGEREVGQSPTVKSESIGIPKDGFVGAQDGLSAGGVKKRAVPEPGQDEKLFEWLRDFQNQEWRNRRASKNPGHVRFAILQFRIDDSYYHPLLDVGFPNSVHENLSDKISFDATCANALAELAEEQAGKAPGHPETTAAQRARAALLKSGLEHNWDRSELLPSWNELRRRRLIESAISACQQFGVDVLVLPEYSVRPDTVEWLRNHLGNLEGSGTRPSVVAGTYRLHGNPKDLHFSQRFSKIFGEADAKKVFDPQKKSMEKSAYLTLLQPAEDVARGFVGVFTRRKKYHSMAMKELINPPSDLWAPLGSLEGLVSSIQLARADLGWPPLDAQDVVKLAKRVRPVERMAELICSELFASTHPVNHAIIESEWLTLRRRFGYDFGEGAASRQVTRDIEQLTDALKLDDRTDRRTIFVVPACTTRSADYWIYGQSALLAAGLTTVFCAAVFEEGKGVLKGGGSCFIANSSWSSSTENAGRLLSATPYSGWSRGIYYNRPGDALGKKEQALIIADIDPIYMNEGRPRPQALPTPIQLVAHLPVVEIVNEKALDAAYSAENGGFERDASKTTEAAMKALGLKGIGSAATAFQDIAEFLSSVRPGDLVSSRDVLGNGIEIGEEAAKMKDLFLDPSGWTSRLECWSKNWREMPFHGAPPTLIDWLPVDLSPVKGQLPTLFVPPWTKDFGGPRAPGTEPSAGPADVLDETQERRPGRSE